MVGMVIGPAGCIVVATRVVGAMIIGRALLRSPMVVGGAPIVQARLTHLGAHVAHATTEVAHAAAEMAATETATEVTSAETAATREDVGGETNGAERDADGQGNDGAANHDRSSGRNDCRRGWPAGDGIVTAQGMTKGCATAGRLR
jgi:hypothetical protein